MIIKISFMAMDTLQLSDESSDWVMGYTTANNTHSQTNKQTVVNLHIDNIYHVYIMLAYTPNHLWQSLVENEHYLISSPTTML